MDTSTETVETRQRMGLRRARVSIAVAFIASGFVIGSWVVNIPRVQQATGISNGLLGTVLVIPAAACIVGVQLCGYLSDRIGSKSTVIAGALLATVAVSVAADATNPWSLGASLAFFGLGLGALDVSMNAQAVLLERDYGRRIMSSFHAYYSLGSAAGGLLAGSLASAGWGLTESVLVSACAGFVVVAATAGGLLRNTRQLPSRSTASTTPRPMNRWTRRIVALGSLAVLLLLCEGAANDWSALQLQDRFSLPAGIAAAGYASFAVSMTIGRLAGDRIAMKLGAIRVLRWGALAAAAAVAVIMFSPFPWLVLVGWGMLGFGLSGCIPLIFSAAGNEPGGTAGIALSRVSGLGYVGLLGGPSLIGWSAQLTSVNTAFVIVLISCLVAACLAGVVRTTSSPRRAEERGQ